MATNKLSTIVTSGNGRIFIAPNRAGCGKSYQYHSCMKIEGLDKSFGDIEPIYCPDPNKLDAFVEVASIQGAESRWTSSLTGRMPLAYKSILSSLANARCAFDLQVHLGKCIDPSNFSTFDQAIILENVSIIDYSTDSLVALSPDERAAVNETSSITAEKVYNVFNISPFRSGDNVTDLGGTPAVTYANIQDCDTCESCMNYFAIRLPIAPVGGDNDLFIAYTEDGGVTWNETLLQCIAPIVNQPWSSYNIETDGTYLYITINETGGLGHLYIVPIDQVLNNNVVSPILNTFNNLSIYDMYLAQNYIIIAQDNGRLLRVNKNGFTYETLLDGTIFPQDLYTVDGIDSNNFIVGGQSGLLLYKRNDAALRQITITINAVPVIADITAVVMKNQKDWIVGTQDGKLYCTGNEGRSWIQLAAFPGCIPDIEFVGNNVGYLIVKSPAQIYRTIDGGNSWTLINDTYNEIPTNAMFLSLDVCKTDANSFVATGIVPDAIYPSPCDPNLLVTTGDQGLIIVGQP